jgi:hypothetical protein
LSPFLFPPRALQFSANGAGSHQRSDVASPVHLHSAGSAFRPSREPSCGEKLFDSASSGTPCMTFIGIIRLTSTSLAEKTKFLVWLPYDEYEGIDPIDLKSDNHTFRLREHPLS